MFPHRALCVIQPRYNPAIRTPPYTPALGAHTRNGSAAGVFLQNNAALPHFTENVFLKLKYPYLALGEYTRGKRFFTVNPARRVFTAG
ncbi:MAG: hypothetical protein KKE86_15165 [Planctomycetes bacterium]|nr:hypothetical protein [Planctomycetota bacterium]MBU4400658.1 hypothetical protein [Planctomycetota bacterium]